MVGETFEVAIGDRFVLVGDLTLGDDVELVAVFTFGVLDWECILDVLLASEAADGVLLAGDLGRRAREGVLLLQLWAGDSVLEIPRRAEGGLRKVEELI